MYKTIKFLLGLTILALALVLLANPTAFARGKDGASGQSLNKASSQVSEQFDGNTIACWMENVGLIVSHRVTGNSGMEWPKGSAKTLDYASGLWLIGKTPAGEIRTACSEYSTEFLPGPILPDGSPADPDNAAYRIYKINGDGTGDWDTWPYDQGAPFTLDATGAKMPKLIGDQTLFWVMNDAAESEHANVFNTKPMGVEQQVTVFGYNTADPLGNIMFVQWKMINKSNTSFTDCYIGVWDDPDLGDASDDLVGCDTTLSLGYCYNGNPVDATYGTTPPALGFDFFQGPMVEGEPLPMTSFVYYWNGAPDPFGDPEDEVQAYNFMRGFASDGSNYVDAAGVPGLFVFAGDPVTQSGWLDSAPADRRFLMSSGPFTLAAGDTQVIVGAKIIAPGTNNLSAVAALRFFDSYAQNAFDNNFELPKPPAPSVQVVNLDGKIVLSWQDEANLYKTIESYSFSGYNFEGYNVYQGESESGPWKRIKTIDVVNDVGIVFDNQYEPATSMVLNLPVAFGENTGLTRNYTVESDGLIVGLPLYNYKKYYFAVTCYAVNPDVSPKIAESGPIPLTAVPGSSFLGVQYMAEEGVSAAATHVAGSSDGTVTVIPVDPAKLTGHTYQVTFDSQEGGYVWKLTDKTTGTVILRNQSNQSGDEDYLIVDGFKLYVLGPPLDINTLDITGTRWVTGTNWGASQFFGAMGVGHDFFGSTVAPADMKPIDIKFYADTTSGPANGWASKGYVYRRDLGYAFAGIGYLPLSAWDISDPDNPRQLNICFVEDVNNGNGNLRWDMGGWDGTQYTGVGAASGGREYLFFMASDYNPDGAVYNDNNFGPEADVLYAIWPAPRGTRPYLQGEFTMTVVPNYINTQADVFEFTTAAPVKTTEIAKTQIEKINVVPNPYFAWNPAERTPTTRILRFTNLPADKVTIRIFDLAGNLVKVIDDELRTAQGTINTPYAEWDLRNAGDVPVASGIFLAHVEVAGVGTKTLKLAIINRDERLLYY